MLYDYDPSKAQTLSLTLAGGRQVRGEFFDGMRLNRDTVPADRKVYFSRHTDEDMCEIATLSPNPIMVNFCGTLVTDTDLGLEEETDVEDYSYGG